MKAVLITSSILIVLIAALRPVLRGRIDPRVQYALWLAAALRLLIPVNLAASAYSALALLERAEQPSPIVETIEAIGQTAIPAPVLAPLSEKDALDLVMKEREQNGQNVTDLSVEETFEVWDQVQELQESTTTLAALAKRLACRPVWLGGAAMMGLWFLLVNLRLRRRLRGALPVETDCPLPVYVTPELPSPCLCGAVRPAIYITPAVLESPERLRHVLAHELTHYRHRDHWWALVRCLCLCVYWFDPLVWWAAALSRQDCELACDEGAIRRLGEDERLPYGRTLVDMIAAGHTPLLQTAATMTSGKRRIRERIKLIAHRPKTVAVVALALVIVLGLAVGCTFTGAPENPAGPEESPPPEPALSAAVPTDSPAPAQQVIQSVVDRLMAEPSLTLTLHLAGADYTAGYSTVPSEDRYAYLLGGLAADFQWEDAPYSTSEGSDTLRVSSADGTVSLLLSKGSSLMLVEQGGETSCYKGQRRYDDDLPYDYLKRWFDLMERETLGATFVPDRGQNHEDIAREWAEGYEGALTKVSPGNPYACTFMEIINVYLPDWTDYEYLEDFARAHGFSAEDFGKTWFGFDYSTMFVPVDDRSFWAGNTRPCEEPGAPEGALTYSRVGYMRLTGEGWTCMGVGSG